MNFSRCQNSFLFISSACIKLPDGLLLGYRSRKKGAQELDEDAKPVATDAVNEKNISFSHFNNHEIYVKNHTAFAIKIEQFEP